MPESPQPLPVREAVRAIIITPEQEVLMLRICAPDREDCFWIMPGGGLETGESVEAALRRELAEEVGLMNVQIGPLLWRRRHTFTWAGKRLCQSERYFAVQHPRFRPEISDPVEAAVVREFRWAPVGELHTIKERITPLKLQGIVRDFLSGGPPLELPPVEVLVD